MKTICAVILTVALPTLSNLAQQSQRTWPWSSEYTSSERGPHHTRWIKLSVVTNELGVSSVQTNSFTQLGAGLNRWSGTAWIDATPELILTNGGVLGRGAQQTAFFAPDFATSRAPVRVWMPNGQLLAFKLLGLAYHDPATGTNILLAAPKSSSPQVVGTNSVWYSDCLDDVRCSIGYYYTADGVRQHVTLKECPAPPSAYGLPDASTRLLVISEIIEGPSPQITERSWPAGREIERDQTLSFSDSMQMVPGRAFSAQDAAPGRGIAVGKTLETVGNRRFVVEGVRYARVRNELLRLPPVGTLLTNASGGIITNASLPKRTRWYAQGTVPPGGIETAQVGHAVPSASPQQTTASQRSQLASGRATPAQEPGFVLDYELVNTTWYGFTFDTSTTWLIYNETHISPSATILPGAVLKYYYGASLHIDGPLDCPDPGPSGQKATLTSCNDDTAGEVFWSNGSPQPGEYGPALVVSCSDLTAAQQRIEARYASPGIIANDGCLSSVSVTASDPLATKGAADSGKFTIAREDGDWSQALTVRFALTGTAVSGVDYQAVPNSATISPWAASVDIVITPGTPGSVAGSSSVVLTLQADSAYVLSPPSSAALTISDPGATTPPPVSAPAGLLDWWRGENDFADIAGGHTGTPANGLGFGSGAVGQAFNFDGTDDRLTASPAEAFNIGPGADFSVEAWIKPLQGYATYGVQTILDKRVAPVGDYQALGYALWLIDGKLGCELADSPMAPYQLHNYGPAGPDLRLDGLFHHVAMTVDRDSTTGGKLYVDGNVVLTFDPTLEPGDLSNSGLLRIGNHANTAISCFFKGIVDEVSLYNHSLSQSEVQSVFRAGARGKTLQNPLQFSAGGYRKSCEDKFYIWVTNTSGLNLTGGQFDLYTTFVPDGGNLYATLQPWGPADVLPNGAAHLFTFCSADHSITNFDCMVVYQGTSGYTISSPKFRIATTNDSALLMKNTTLVRQPCVECGNCEGNPQDLIPPEARTACDSAKGIVSCGPEHCGTWASLLPASSSAAGAASRLDNYYKVADPPTKVELPCSNRGFKNVYAIKQWHGAWGPKSPMWNPVAGMNWDGTCRAPSGPANSLDSTKYLTLDATSAATSYTYCLSSTPASVTQAATVTSTCTVDPLSGRRVGGGSHSGDEPLMASALEALQNANVTIASLPDTYSGWVGSQVLSLSNNLITSDFSSAPSASASRQYDDGSESYWNAQVDLTGGTFTATTGWQSGTSPSYSTTTIQVSVGETEVHCSHVEDWEAYSGDLLVQKFSGSNYVEATLRTAYTSANVDADCDALLAKWNLLDDIEYPWRTDPDLTRGPLVTYNECGPTAPAIVPPDFEETNSVPWPSQAPRTILGEPLSVHGPNGELYSYEPYFNFYHINWRFEDSVRGHPQGFVKSYGAASPYPNATQWVDDDQARVFPAGPFWAFGSEFEEADHLMFRLKSPYITDTEGEWEQGGYGGFVKCKWAEKLDPALPPGKEVLFKDWKFNLRDFIGSYSWNATAWSWNNSTVGCAGFSEVPPVRFSPFIVPGAGYYIGPGSWWISEMHTTSLHYSFDCCRPAVFVQPNPPGPDCTNGIFIPMPAGVCDARYGSLWMGRVDQSTAEAHTCDNYVANRNAGIANSPACDPQIDLDLLWHSGPKGGGAYELFVAPLGFTPGGSGPEPLVVDLDIDSDNDNGNQPPSRSSGEDEMEDDLTKPGKIIAVNDGDSDDDGIPGFADGFNWHWLSDSDTSSDHFVPLVLEIPVDLNVSDCSLRISYSGSDPAKVTHDPQPPDWEPLWKPAPGNLRIWKKDGNQARTPTTAQAAVNPGDYVAPGMYTNITNLGFSSGTRTVILYLEGIAPSAYPGDLEITATLYANGEPPRFVGSDAVRVTALSVQLDIDSDNNNGFDPPSGDLVERVVRYRQLPSFPDYERVRYPGKVLMANEGDLDGDGVPDFADNLDVFQDDGVALQGEQWPECPRFVPMLLNLGKPGSYDSMRLRFTYPASDPANMQRTSDGTGGFTYVPAPGSLRIWTKDGIKKRKVALVSEGGDYVPTDVELKPSDLGFIDGTSTVTLYVEAVNVSADVADLEIKVSASLQSEPSYLLSDFVRVTALNLALMNVDQNNNVTKATHIETSQATPVVTLNSVSVSQVQPSPDAQIIVGTLNLAGSIASAVQNITPISANQNISEVLVYLNDSEDPIGAVAVTFTKTEDESSFLHPFPYNGSFAGSVQNVPLLEGVNVIRVVAKDPVDGMEGYTEYSFEVEGISPYAQTSASLDVQLTGPLSAGFVDTITATLVVSGGETLASQTLTETAPDSRVFENAGGTFRVTIRTGGESLDAAAVDEVYAVTTASALGVTDLPFPLMQETGADTKLFHQSVFGGTLASLDVEMTGPLSDTTAETITATLTVPGIGSIVRETLTETAADSRVFVNAAQSFQITINAGAETLDAASPDEIHAVVTEGALGVTELAFSFMRETGNDTKIFHKDIYSSDEYVADYTGFTFSLSQLSQVGASGGGLFKPYVLQVQGPDLFLEHLEWIELDDGPRGIEKSPIDNKWYVKMKNSPPLVGIFEPKRFLGLDPSEPVYTGNSKEEWVAYLNQHDPEMAQELGFVDGFGAGGSAFLEGTWQLARTASVGAYNYQTYVPKVVWRMFHGDFFETERSSVAVGAQNALKIAHVMDELATDRAKILAALNGQHVDANDLSPYSLGLIHASELLGAYKDHLLANFQNDPYKRGYYSGRAAFEIAMVILPLLDEANGPSKIAKGQFLTNLRELPFFKTGEGAAAFTKLESFLSRLWTTKICFVAGTKILTDEGPKNIEEIHPGDYVLSRDEATSEQAWKEVLDTVTTRPTELFEIHLSVPTNRGPPSDARSEQLPADELTTTGEHPFYVSNRNHPGFVSADELQSGDELLTAYGGAVIVTGIERRWAPQGQHFTTYNLEVADFHTYFVGTSGVWVHNFSTRFCDEMFARCERAMKEFTPPITDPTGRKFEILKKVFESRPRFKRGASDANFAMHITAREANIDYAARFPTCSANNPVEEIYSVTQQRGLIYPQFRAEIWQVHHLAEERISRAFGIAENFWGDSPSINLPKNLASVKAEDLAAYQAKWGDQLVPHQGPGGIKEALDDIFKRHGFNNPYRTLSASEQQMLLDELHILYAQDSRYAHLKAWPVVRDWLKRHCPNNSLVFPN